MDADDPTCSQFSAHRGRMLKATHANWRNGWLLCSNCAQQQNSIALRRGLDKPYIPMKEYVMKCLMKVI